MCFLATRTNLSPKCVPVIQLFLTLLIFREEMEAAVERDEFLEVHICWWHPDFCLSYPGAKLQWLYTTLSQTVTNVLNVCAYAPPKIVQKLWLLYGHCINSIGTFCHDFTTQQESYFDNANNDDDDDDDDWNAIKSYSPYSFLFPPDELGFLQKYDYKEIPWVFLN